MNVTLRKSGLSRSRRALVECMQAVGFGRIKQLRVLNGEPVVEPPPAVTHEVKFGSQNGPHTQAGLIDYALKSQVVELFEQLESLRDGTIDVLVIRHGLPFSMEFRAGPADVGLRVAG